MKNDLGFDESLTTKIEDNPFWDCTDGAHPAWWRGEAYSYKMLCKKVNAWLDGNNLGGCSQPELQNIKEKIILLRSKNESI